MDPKKGFILVPYMKWSGEQVEDLYLQAIVMDREIGSIRDLRGCHIPLLENIYDKCTVRNISFISYKYDMISITFQKAIQEKYKVPAHKLRIYFHYQPSYYHLHIHFSALCFEAPGIYSEFLIFFHLNLFFDIGTWAGKAVLLKEVLANLQMDSDYYSKATLSFTLKDNHPLWSKYKELGKLIN